MNKCFVSLISFSGVGEDKTPFVLSLQIRTENWKGVQNIDERKMKNKKYFHNRAEAKSILLSIHILPSHFPGIDTLIIKKMVGLYQFYGPKSTLLVEEK